MPRGNKDGHRRFGLIRKLPSGRFQASYLGPDGLRRAAPTTYETKRDAEQFLVRVEAAMMSDEWTDPIRAKVVLGDYAERWITERAGLRPRTVQLYRWLWTKHIGPYLGPVQLGQLSAAMVRQWRSERLEAGVSQSVTAKSYRLLRAVLATAVEEDRILMRNPCRVKGADRESPAERPVLTVAQVYQLAEAMRFDRFRALILLTVRHAAVGRGGDRAPAM
jgi:hypothetical protein